jgi:hypothetical protein
VEEVLGFLVVEVEVAFLVLDEEATLTRVDEDDALSLDALVVGEAFTLEAAWGAEADEPSPINLLTGVAPGKYVVPIVGIGILAEIGKPDARSWGMVAAE